MEHALTHIIEQVRATGAPLATPDLLALIRQHNQGVADVRQHLSKKKLLAAYLRHQDQASAQWQAWDLDAPTHQAVLQTLQAKPRRTASGIASITVITKPWPCAGNCAYCPNDLRMPKSYLSNEPACQRAERNYFDPYLQVMARLRSLMRMGHVTQKIELIVLGGTWSDYPEGYQLWFMTRVFQALNDAEDGIDVGENALRTMDDLRAAYAAAGLQQDEAALAAAAAPLQERVDAGQLTYAQAFPQLYEGPDSPWTQLAPQQTATLADLERQQRINESAAHRVVGLVVETRPDLVTPANLTLLRRMGCTKVQIGVQSLDPAVLKANHRRISPDQIKRAFALLRLFGFKSHTHFMVNLLGSDPESDRADFRQFITDPAYSPDEVKLYPCFLMAGTDLVAAHDRGDWRAYDEATLTSVLADDVLATPPFTRISRMIRDFSAEDIVAGCRKTNLRQMVEAEVARRSAERNQPVQEIRFREIVGENADPAALRLTDHTYRTTVSTEHFLQWVTPENRIAGFLRLSLPHWDHVATALSDEDRAQLPTAPGQAMIREVHVYGKVARLHTQDQNAQHLGLGRQLVERAAELARAAGCTQLNVISSVGTRGYYEKLGFALRPDGLYQTRVL
ncbi:MAG: tRNA uridine(34) 5-carboxymethylaminomethyl modification radical SAM/GNAT enzyme Elp3 [Coriobacteriia bacterium]|nr:tRNA uridine(34) 5-carboxymethylaminomethyl modification radical SAM/GNAT enzyme Elp3 [Coriobacteriia bacterium]